MTDVYTPPTPTDILQNPIRNAEDWRRMREDCEKDVGAFHGDIAARAIHWFHPQLDAWLTLDATDTWRGWNAQSGEHITLPSWVPWQQALDESNAPFYHWFVGAQTNAAFNEVDRHVLAGHGRDTAFFYEGDRWDPASNNGRGGPVQQETLSRRELLAQSVIAAQALTDLGLSRGDCIAINMPNILPQIIWTEAAKRIGVIYTPVFGGFSDKTLSDRIENAGAKVVITADGASRNAEVAGFKEVYTDPALDRYISVASALSILENVAIDSATKAGIIAHVQAQLGEEITLTRAEIMREVGQVLASADLEAAAIAGLRAELAAALSNSPARVATVIVVRHAGLTDIAWREGRDVWAHELLAAAEANILARAGLNNRAALDALDDRDYAAALWQSLPPLPVAADFP